MKPQCFLPAIFCLSIIYGNYFVNAGYLHITSSYSSCSLLRKNFTA